MPGVLHVLFFLASASICHQIFPHLCCSSNDTLNSNSYSSTPPITLSAVIRQQCRVSFTYPSLPHMHSNTHSCPLPDPSDLQWESTILRDQPTSKAHIVAVDKWAGVTLTVNHTEIDRVTSCHQARLHFFHGPTDTHTNNNKKTCINLIADAFFNVWLSKIPWKSEKREVQLDLSRRNFLETFKTRKLGNALSISLSCLHDQQPISCSGKQQNHNLTFCGL